MNAHLKPPSDPSVPRLTLRHGKTSMILLWALGVPIPILLIIFLVRGCGS